MTSSWSRRRWLWASAATLLVVAAGAATVWVVHDSATPLEKDCAAVQDLGLQTRELGARMNAGPDGRFLVDPSEIVEMQSALSDKIRATAGSVSTPAMKKPLITWSDAVTLDAQLQREANHAAPGADPPARWMTDAQRANLLTQEALDPLDRQCPGLKRTIGGS